MSDIFLGEYGEGGDFRFAGQDIANDNGLATSIYLSLFAGNSYAKLFDPDIRTDMKFQQALYRTVTQATLNEMKAEAESALQWLIDKGTASKVEITVTAPRYNKVNILVYVEEPNGQENEFEAIWNAEKNNVARFVSLNEGYGE